MLNFLTKGISQIFGTKSDKDNKELQPYVKLTNDEFVKLANLSHDEFRAKTKELQVKMENAQLVATKLLTADAKNTVNRAIFLLFISMVI
jgi:preprotein translocase subunit SecA